MIKLRHLKTDLFLSSIDVHYQTGSTQQIVRGVNRTKMTLAETFWNIFPIETSTNHYQGEPVQCGSEIRLLHTVTQKWLHSHAIKGQLEHGYEVSAFEGSDTGDVWKIICDEDIWTYSTTFKLFHRDTSYYLSANLTGKYEKEIMGEYEVFGDEKDDENDWISSSGIFVKEL